MPNNREKYLRPSYKLKKFKIDKYIPMKQTTQNHMDIEYKTLAFNYAKICSEDILM